MVKNMYDEYMRQQIISLMCTVIIGLSGSGVFTFFLSTIGGVLVILNQIYKTRKDIREHHNGDVKKYLKSLYNPLKRKKENDKNGNE